jgi:hypothetical protein
MRKFFTWLAVCVAVLLLIAWAVLFYFEEPIRAFVEKQLNAGVQGYHFVIGKAHLYPNLSLDLKEVVMIQTDHPEPPVANIPRWHFSIQWRHLLSGVLVSDYLIERPTLYITLPQAQKEVEDKVPIHEKGWRDAVYSFYPFDINEFKVTDADVTYVDQDPSRPLHLTHLNFRAGNIRNIHSRDDAYPSDINFMGNIFDSGRIRLNGHANFLAEPRAGIDASIALDHIPLEPLLPVTGRYNVHIRGGVLSTDGHVESTAEGETEVNLKNLTIDNVKVDYVHSPVTLNREARVAKATAATAKKLHNKPEIQIKIEHAVIKNSEFAFVNETVKPPYRAFLSKAELRLNNISNNLKGLGLITLKGAFMGTGETLFSGTFRPASNSQDFDLNVKIENTQMRAMNDLLRAYAGFDVTAGLFSVYSEISVKNGAIHGYVKPLFKDLKIYDPHQDKDKSFSQKLYEGVVGGIASLLENEPRQEVATKTEISGEVGNLQTSTWQTVMHLIQNAFFKAILPGFEREAERA